MNYKECRNYLNQQRFMFEGVGKYDIPQLEPCDVNLDGAQYIPFNYAKTTSTYRKQKIIHFFVDDYQFERVWANPDKYIALFSDFRAITVPDFSTYRDYPMALQIYNHFRKHWIEAYYQRAGINVIPIIRWSTKESYEWCFDGEPTNSIVATGTIGCFSDETGKRLFDDGFNKMLKLLEPSQVLLYTSQTKYQDEANVPYISNKKVKVIYNDCIKRLRGLKK